MKVTIKDPEFNKLQGRVEVLERDRSAMFIFLCAFSIGLLVLHYVTDYRNTIFHNHIDNLHGDTE